MAICTLVQEVLAIVGVDCRCKKVVMGAET